MQLRNNVHKKYFSIIRDVSITYLVSNDTILIVPEVKRKIFGLFSLAGIDLLPASFRIALLQAIPQAPYNITTQKTKQDALPCASTVNRQLNSSAHKHHISRSTTDCVQPEFQHRRLRFINSSREVLTAVFIIRSSKPTRLPTPKFCLGNSAARKPHQRIQRNPPISNTNYCHNNTHHDVNGEISRSQSSPHA